MRNSCFEWLRELDCEDRFTVADALTLAGASCHETVSRLSAICHAGPALSAVPAVGHLILRLGFT
jgi:hypothetical protein